MGHSAGGDCGPRSAKRSSARPVATRLSTPMNLECARSEHYPRTGLSVPRHNHARRRQQRRGRCSIPQSPAILPERDRTAQGQPVGPRHCARCSRTELRPTETPARQSATQRRTVVVHSGAGRIEPWLQSNRRCMGCPPPGGGVRETLTTPPARRLDYWALSACPRSPSSPSKVTSVPNALLSRYPVISASAWDSSPRAVISCC